MELLKLTRTKNASTLTCHSNTMIELHNHPNFPEKLAISPLLPFDTHCKRISDDQQFVFGAEAQRIAIETYGIAGRVW